MGNTLSTDEKQQLQPYLEGFNPALLSVIIWDTIKEVSQDDDQDEFGIHFSTPDEVKMYGNSTVTFWDDNGLQQLPRKIFLQILQFVAETTLENYTMAYDLEHSPELQSGVFRLELALKNLVNEIDTLDDDEDVKQYRERIESETESENKNNEQDPVPNTTIIKQIRERRGSCSWITADNEEDETIVNDLPETIDSPSNLTPTSPTSSPNKSILTSPTSSPNKSILTSPTSSPNKSILTSPTSSPNKSILRSSTSSPNKSILTSSTTTPNKPRLLKKTSSGQSSDSESLSPIKEESLDDVFLPNNISEAPKMTSLTKCGKSVSIGWLSENDENDYIPIREQRRRSSGRGIEGVSVGWSNEMDENDYVLSKGHRRRSSERGIESVSVGWSNETDENDYVLSKGHRRRRRSSERGIEGVSLGWLNETDENDYVLSRGHRRRSSGRGIEGVVERLPELRARYEKGLSMDSQDEEQGSRAKFQRVRTKLRALSIFKAPTIIPVIEENDSEDRTGRRPSLNTISTSLHSSVDSVSSASSEK